MPRLLLIILIMLSTAPALHADLFCNGARGFGALDSAFSSDSVLMISNPGPGVMSLPLPEAPDYLNIRVINRHSNPNRSYPATDHEGSRIKVRSPEWGVMFSNGPDTLRYSFSTVNPPDALGEPLDRMRIKISPPSASPQEILLTSDVELFDRPNLFIFYNNDGGISLRLGNSATLKDLGEVPFRPHAQASVFLNPGAAIELLDMTLRARTEKDIMSQYTAQTLMSTLDTCTEPLSGLYELYEFDIDKDNTILPDRLRIAIIPDSTMTGAYTLVYVSGYSSSDPAWRPGMRKGKITPSPFRDYFYLEWITADGLPISKGCSLTSDNLPVLRVQLPYHNAGFTLRRIPDPGKYIRQTFLSDE